MSTIIAALVTLGAVIYFACGAIARYRIWRDDRLIRGAGVQQLPDHWRPQDRPTYETRYMDDLRREVERR